jgi:hypothetical protein
LTFFLKAFPELLSAAILLALWIEPLRFGTGWFRSGVLTLLLEFFVIHASGFMAVLMYDPETPRARRALQVGGLGAGYLVFVGAIAWGVDAWWMVAAFVWLCFSKLQAIWSGAAPTERDRTLAIVSWALSVTAYLGMVALTAFADVPALGVTPEIRDVAGFDAHGGLWEAEPHRALAGAVLYFTLMGLSRPLLAWAFTERR